MDTNEIKARLWDFRLEESAVHAWSRADTLVYEEEAWDHCYITLARGDRRKVILLWEEGVDTTLLQKVANVFKVSRGKRLPKTKYAFLCAQAKLRWRALQAIRGIPHVWDASEESWEEGKDL